MKSDFLETPGCMNMGFHYTNQYSRRSRVNVMGIVDQSTEEWKNWYLKMHEFSEVKKMADVGYDFMEIHFLYGFGMKSEREEIELTKKMVSNAHRSGLKVLGYFQFFSVQEELFFVENPWAKNCLQIKADGTRHEYAYDRPALCFTHKKVQDYYLKGIESGLKYCDLDGIRLDNDYYKGCFCENCQKEFRAYLKKNFPPELARRVFGFEDLSGMSLVKLGNDYVCKGKDPLWSAMIKFRQEQRQKIMKLISDKIISIKPDAILGGNPAVGRKPSEIYRLNFYAPDFGETHHLICAENSLFPGIKNNSIKHQAVIYKHGQSSSFKVFPSHHLHTENGGMRWPDTNECALSFGEALAFGGHVLCTTWGMRMDGNNTLYQRKPFIDALSPFSSFIRKHKSIYRNVDCSADIGIYMNRESMICDNAEAWHSMQGTVQILLENHIPFRFIDKDDDKILKDLKLLIIPDVKLITDKQISRFKKFLRNSQIIMTGKSGTYDEYYLKRSTSDYMAFAKQKNMLLIDGTPEKAHAVEEQSEHGRYDHIKVPATYKDFLSIIEKAYKPFVTLKGSHHIALDTFKNAKGEHFIHIVNYDNSTPSDFDLSFNSCGRTVEIYYPEKFGAMKTSITTVSQKTIVKIKKLHTYLVIKIK